MARQKLGEKKTEKLREKTGLPIIAASVRGGTDHRVDLFLEDGTMAYLFQDGTLQLSTDRHALAKDSSKEG